MLLTANCGLITDDYHFLFVWCGFLPNGNDKPIGDITDIFISAKNYYLHSGGRIIAHFVAFVFINLNKWLFNIVNSFIFVILGILIRKIVCVKDSKSPVIQLVIYFSMFFFLPSFGDTVLWISGSVNYLWTSALLLYTIYFCQKHIADNSKRAFFVMPILFFISSATNETTGGILLVWFTVYLINTKYKPDFRAILNYITSVLGIMLVIAAPGNRNRAALVEQTNIFSFGSFFALLKSYIDWFINDYKVIVFLYAITVIILCIFRNKEVITMSLSYVIAGFAGLSALTITGFFSLRPTFFAVLLMLVGLFKTAFAVFSMKLDQMSDQMFQRSVIAFVCAFIAVIVYNIMYALLYILDTSFSVYTYVSLLICTACFILPYLKFRTCNIISQEKSDMLKEKLQSVLKMKVKMIYTPIIIIFSAFLVYNACDYCITMSNGKDFLCKRYESYITNGDIDVEDKMLCDNIYIPDEMFASGEYTCQWINECYKYNIQKHELDEYYDIIRANISAFRSQNL